MEPSSSVGPSLLSNIILFSTIALIVYAIIKFKRRAKSKATAILYSSHERMNMEKYSELEMRINSLTDEKLLEMIGNTKDYTQEAIEVAKEEISKRDGRKAVIQTPTDINKRMVKQCPYCSEEILLTAIKCKHCGELLNQENKNEIPIERPVPSGLIATAWILMILGFIPMGSISLIISIAILICAIFLISSKNSVGKGNGWVVLVIWVITFFIGFSNTFSKQY